MHGRRVLSFFSTKKNPAPAGEADGCLIPAARVLNVLIVLVLILHVHYRSNVWGHLEMSLFLKEKDIFCPLK